MNINEVVSYWLEKHNKHFGDHINNRDEPRYNKKQFLLYSYKFLQRINKSDNSQYAWSRYLDNGFEDIFRRDPSNDYYGYRSPIDKGNERRNTAEWINIFEIIGEVGFPYNDSAQRKLIKRAKRFLDEAKEDPYNHLHNLMLCSAVKNLPEEFKNTRENIPKMISEHFEKSETPTLHELIAYLKALDSLIKYGIDNTNLVEIRGETVERIKEWTESSQEGPRRQILMWARLVTRAEEIELPMNKKEKTTIFFDLLSEIENIEWFNSPLILECAYLLSSSTVKDKIGEKIIEEIIPYKLFKLKEVFPFLEEGKNLTHLQSEIESIREKCDNSPTNEKCKKCIDEPQGECWIRIIAKLLEVKPKTHGPFEVADIVLYTFSKGVFFVIKAQPIERPTEGDTLLRQCVDLFKSENALVFYLNPHYTHPHVVKKIREQAEIAETDPEFIVIPNYHLRQIYNYYKDIG